MKGLIIKEPWIDHILDDEKAWEIRGRGTKIRGTIALIKSGTGLVLGLVDVVDSLELTPDAFYQAEAQHRIPNPATRPLPYPRIYAWVLAHPKRLLVPQPYVNPQGAIIWVNLPEDMDLTRAV